MRTPVGIKSYVYPCENDIARLLDSAFVQGAIRKIANYYYSEQVADAIKRGVVVTRNCFPSLYRVIDYCAHQIELPTNIVVILTSRLKGANALAVENEGNGVVFLSNSSITRLNEEELSFMLGHEFGHIAQGNLSCHTIKGMIDNLKDASVVLGELLSDMIEVPLNKWYRCSEYTADRAGLICCKSLTTSLSVMHKLLPRFDESHSVENYLELSSSHPFLYHREVELIKFAQISGFAEN